MKANHKKVLILMSNNGGGHISSSEAIKQIITRHSPKTEVKIVNMTPAISPVIYRFASNYLPQI
ncbi:galactosyldiacylglycerol synthase, partial [Microgenomates group bacterium]|nr:galactosyldiacylglycerol synthase [Microgenomates group bacterium]